MYYLYNFWCLGIDNIFQETLLYYLKRWNWNWLWLFRSGKYKMTFYFQQNWKYFFPGNILMEAISPQEMLKQKLINISKIWQSLMLPVDFLTQSSFYPSLDWLCKEEKKSQQNILFLLVIWNCTDSSFIQISWFKVIARWYESMESQSVL